MEIIAKIAFIIHYPWHLFSTAPVPIVAVENRCRRANTHGPIQVELPQIDHCCLIHLQISFEDVLSPIADLLDPCDPDISEPDVVSVDDVDDEDDGSGGEGNLWSLSWQHLVTNDNNW